MYRSKLHAYNHDFLRLFLLVLGLYISVYPQQLHSKHDMALNRRNPDGWYSFLVPKALRNVERHADVDGGFYMNRDFNIDFDFWPFEGTPNFLRDVNGKYSKSPILACSTKKRTTQTLRTKIGGERAIVQSCPNTNRWKGFRFIYYVTFPKLKVFNGEDFRDGIFSLTVKYKDRRYATLAQRIIRSIKFNRKTSNLKGTN